MARKPTKRPYRKRKRAEAEEETRRRITEAAVELHGTVGPANTRVTDLAERAGVSRMTVYNHFPTEIDLFRACSSHWERQHPFPEPAPWRAEPDPAVRLRAALGVLYAWYERNQGMLGNVIRDASVLPALGRFMEGHWGGYMDAVVDALSDGWPGAGGASAELRASLRVAVDFHTWRLLAAAGLGPGEAVDIAARMARGVVRTAAG